MKNWLKSFPLQQIHIVDGDQLIADPYTEVIKVEKFLGLRHEITRDKFRFDENKGFFCLNVEAARNNGCLAKTKGNVPPPIREEVLQKLNSYFRPLNMKFFEQIQRKFDWSN